MGVTTQPGEINYRKSKVIAFVVKLTTVHKKYKIIAFVVNAGVNITADNFYV